MALPSSVMNQTWLEPGPWERAGRGRSWTFALPTGEVVAVLSALAEARGDDWTLLQCSQAVTNGESRSFYEPRHLHELALEGPHRYFIRSRSLTPVVPKPEPLAEPGWPAKFAINGLIVLDHPDLFADPSPWPQSAIGIVHRVVNTTNGHIVEHASYDELFKALKARLHSRLRTVAKPKSSR
jgi:hypothetical protein